MVSPPEITRHGAREKEKKAMCVQTERAIMIKLTLTVAFPPLLTRSLLFLYPLANLSRLFWEDQASK